MRAESLIRSSLHPPLLVWLAPVLVFGFACAAPAEKPVARTCTAACVAGDCRDGIGTYRYADCTTYTGDFRGGVRHGRGVYEFASRDIYEGEYRRGRRSGAGGYRFDRGGEFLGGFSGARFLKPDTLAFDDGARLQGAFVARAAATRGWRTGARVNGVEAYGTLRRDDAERLCASFRRILLCETDTAPGRLTGTSLGSPARNRFLLMLYSGQEVNIKRSGASLLGRSGMLLRPGDLIEVAQFSVEIQTAGGTAIRLKPGSLLFIPMDFARSGILELRRGGLLVRTGKNAKQAGPPLRIRSGGTLYSVNGTEFSVETDDSGRMSRVKVYSGEIVLSPDVPSIEKFSRAEIEAAPELKRVIESINQRPLRVRPGESAQLNEETRKWAGALNQALEQQQADQDPSTKLKQLVEDAPKQNASKSTFKETPQERSERRLLTTVDEDSFDQAVEEGASKGGVSTEVQADIVKKFEEVLNKNADELTGELSREQPAENVEDLKRIYSTLEVLVFHDGKKKAGSVVAQVGGLLILHSTDGVFRTRIDDVRYIDLYHQGDEPPTPTSP